VHIVDHARQSVLVQAKLHGLLIGLQVWFDCLLELGDLGL